MLNLVVERPEIGRAFTTRKGLSVRRFIVNSHLVVYRETKTGVAILRIAHQLMDPNQYI